ncbi:hypothetical protein [Dactylosporangium sp. NPDC000521]|uniref:glycine-rich domain-containing protein n=1 Tax=Dactylosporangium sp. NPDC000521 TaxID=3363975 RepID=UPI0036AFB9E0
MTMLVPVAPAAAAPGKARTTESAPTSFTTTSADTYTMPAGVTEVDVVVIGGRGGNVEPAKGGLGAKVSGRLTVTPGETLNVFVGDSVPSAASAPVVPAAPVNPPVPPAPQATLDIDTGTQSGVLRPGSAVTVSGDGFAPHSTVTVTIYSTPVALHEHRDRRGGLVRHTGDHAGRARRR